MSNGGEGKGSAVCLSDGRDKSRCLHAEEEGFKSRLGLFFRLLVLLSFSQTVLESDLVLLFFRSV